MPFHPGYEMKATYQRNMLIGLVATVFFSGAVALLIVYLDPGSPIPASGRTSRRSENGVTRREEAKRPRSLSATLVDSPPPKSHNQNSRGFGGFARYRIIPDNPRQVEIQAPHQIYARESVPLIIDSTSVFSDLEGYDDEVFLANPGDDYFFPEDTASVRRMADHDVRLIRKVAPEVPWLARKNKVEGYVEILLYLDKNGKPVPYTARPCEPGDSSAQFYLDCRLKDGQTARLAFFIDPAVNGLLYLVLTEEPVEYDFAKNLTDVLPQWVFAPRVREGRPVEAFVRLGFWFCDPPLNGLDCPNVTMGSL